VPPQALGTQRQSAQVPTFGPPESPLAHSQVDSHQPQPAAPVQSPQTAFAAQGSTLGQLTGTQRQS
jgi:hypothetical protein